jgi:hypothetical protein
MMKCINHCQGLSDILDAARCLLAPSGRKGALITTTINVLCTANYLSLYQNVGINMLKHIFNNACTIPNWGDTSFSVTRHDLFRKT